MYFDGALNALGCGVRAVLISPEGNHCSFTAKLSFECTNNVAEYEACVLGLQAIIEKKIKSLSYWAVMYVMRTGKKCAALVSLSSITHIESNPLTAQGNPVTKFIVIYPISTRKYLIFEVYLSTFDTRP